MVEPAYRQAGWQTRLTTWINNVQGLREKYLKFGIGKEFLKNLIKQNCPDGGTCLPAGWLVDTLNNPEQ